MEQTKKRKRVTVNSPGMVFRIRRRLYRFEQWKLPLPYGVELRTVGYIAGVYVTLLLLRQLPGLGPLTGALPAQLYWGTLPVALVLAMLKLQYEGRSPHALIAGAVHAALRPRRTSGLRPIAREQRVLRPIGELVIKPDLHSPTFTAGVIKGPAKLLVLGHAEIRARKTNTRRGRRPRGVVEIEPGAISGAAQTGAVVQVRHDAEVRVR